MELNSQIGKQVIVRVDKAVYNFREQFRNRKRL